MSWFGCRRDQLLLSAYISREFQESEGQDELLDMVFSVMIEVCG